MAKPTHIYVIEEPPGDLAQQVTQAHRFPITSTIEQTIKDNASHFQGRPILVVTDTKADRYLPVVTLEKEK